MRPYLALMVRCSSLIRDFQAFGMFPLRIAAAFPDLVDYGQDFAARRSLKPLFNVPTRSKFGVT